MASLEKFHFKTAEDEKLIEAVQHHAALYDPQCPGYKDQVVRENLWKEVVEIVGRPDRDCRQRWKNIKDTYDRRKRKGISTGSLASGKSGKKWALADMLSFLDNIDHQRSGVPNIPRSRTQTSVDVGGENADSDEDNGDPSAEDDTVNDGIKSENPEVNVPSTPLLQEQHVTRETSVANRIDNNRLVIGRAKKRSKINDRIVNVMEKRDLERIMVIKKLMEVDDDDIDLFFRSVALSVKKLRPDLRHEAKLKTLQIVSELESRMWQYEKQTLRNLPSASTSGTVSSASNNDAVLP